jgi:23S rRNA pseudouridine1911/1915/1917 synthase
MEGLRVDVALASMVEGLSRSRAKALIEQGRALLDGQKVKPSQTVRAGEWIEVELPAEEELRLVPEALSVEVVYDDAFLLVVNKPAGMTVHPSETRRSGTLMNALLASYPSLGEMPAAQSPGPSGPERLRPGVVHRLDKDTSGLMVVAKTEPDQRALASQVKARAVVRRYLALVWGVPDPPAGRLEAPIGRHPIHRKRMAVTESALARQAVTDYRTLLRLGAMTLIEARLVTGRTHQIRVHFAHFRHPVVGDPVYGGGQRRLLEGLPPEVRDIAAALSGQALHAYFLSFAHPRTGRRLNFFSLPRQEIMALIAAARRPGE